MVKGCQKKMIHITNTGSPYFEEAYFILKKNDSDSECGTQGMVREAMKLADGAARSTLSKSLRAKRVKAIYFLLGAAACSLVFGTVMLISIIM